MIGKDWTFKLSDTQYEKLNYWYNTVIKAGYETNKYGSAIGGCMTFQITPTSIGEVVTVHWFNEELNLTEL